MTTATAMSNLASLESQVDSITNLLSEFSELVRLRENGSINNEEFEKRYSSLEEKDNSNQILNAIHY